MNEIKINKPVYDRINDLEQWKGVKIGKYWILRTQFGYLVYLYSMINDDEVDPIYSSREVQDIIDYIDGKINEIKRLQQLAGINEIKVNNPIYISPENMIPGRAYEIKIQSSNMAFPKIKKLVFEEIDGEGEYLFHDLDDISFRSWYYPKDFIEIKPIKL